MAIQSASEYTPWHKQWCTETAVMTELKDYYAMTRKLIDTNCSFKL